MRVTVTLQREVFIEDNGNRNQICCGLRPVGGRQVDLTRMDNLKKHGCWGEEIAGRRQACHGAKGVSSDARFLWHVETLMGRSTSRRRLCRGKRKVDFCLLRGRDSQSVDPDRLWV